jgi:tetratricopeptide (TPR) repeat protein
MRTFGTFAAVLLALMIGAFSDAAGDGGSDESKKLPPAASSDYQAGKAAVEAEDYQRAIGYMTKVVATAPDNADALNYLGYSHRKLGRFDESLVWYQKALAANPNHRGANEYLGELYLQMGDLAKAEERLNKLNDLCFFGCEEYDDLKEEIAEYKAGQAASAKPQ